MSGDKILIARRKYNLNQADVYIAAGMNKQTYLDIERGRVPITKAYATELMELIRQLGEKKRKETHNER